MRRTKTGSEERPVNASRRPQIQFELVFTPAPRPSTFRQSEFPWRYRSDRRKPAFYTFRFPFTAYRKRGVAQIWGLAPRRGRVSIQIRRGGRWRRYKRLRTHPGRLFFIARRVRRGKLLRARQGQDVSLTWRVGPNATE